MDPIDRVPFLSAVAVMIEPKELGAPDIIKVVVQRDGQIVEPLASTLLPREFKSRMGAVQVIHSGMVTYSLSAFAPSGTVIVTAIPESGQNLRIALDSALLARLK